MNKKSTVSGQEPGANPQASPPQIQQQVPPKSSVSGQEPGANPQDAIIGAAKENSESTAVELTKKPTGEEKQPEISVVEPSEFGKRLTDLETKYNKVDGELSELRTDVNYLGRVVEKIDRAFRSNEVMLFVQFGHQFSLPDMKAVLDQMFGAGAIKRVVSLPQNGVFKAITYTDERAGDIISHVNELNRARQLNFRADRSLTPAQQAMKKQRQSALKAQVAQRSLQYVGDKEFEEEAARRAEAKKAEKTKEAPQHSTQKRGTKSTLPAQTK